MEDGGTSVREPASAPRRVEAVNMLTVLVSTDEPIVELDVKALLGSDPQFNLLEVCKTQPELLRATRHYQPDVVVCGLSRESELGGIQELQAASLV